MNDTDLKPSLIILQDILKDAIENNITSASDLPYFEGDFWPNVLEDSIKELEQEEEEKRKREEAEAAMAEAEASVTTTEGEEISACVCIDFSLLIHNCGCKGSTGIISCTVY